MHDNAHARRNVGVAERLSVRLDDVDTMHSHIEPEDYDVKLTFLGRGGSEAGGCPSLYSTDRDSFLVQGWRTTEPGTVEIPHLLTGFAEPDTFIGATMVDSSRGTFIVSGEPVTAADILTQLELADDEAAIEVARKRRMFYGAADRR